MKKSNLKSKIKTQFRRWDSGEIDLTEEIVGDSRASVTKRKHTDLDDGGFFTETLEYKSDFRSFRRIYPILAAVLGLSIIITLLFTVSHLPTFGSPDSPTNNEVSQKYLEDGVADTGATNIVAAMILDYRAFDTLGESHVLFASLGTVLILLLDNTGLVGKSSKREDQLFDLSQDIILRVIVKILVPAIILFGIYVILNGHISPGGGFSGGAIIGAGFMLYSMAFGFDKIQKFLNKRTFGIIVVCALAFYSTVSNLSYITFGVLLLTPAGLSAGLMHMLFHGTTKILAFFCAGAVLHHSGREFVAELDGIGYRMPITFGCFAVSALALTGIPLFDGFVSKWNLLVAAAETASPLALAGAVVLLVSALLTAVYMLTVVVRAFFPSRETDTAALRDIHEAGGLMCVPMVILAFLCVLFGVWAMPLVQLTQNIATGLF
jgi:multisubunit Na+/H+ antiporter MnhB subunit